MGESAWMDCGCLRVEGHRFPCSYAEIARLEKIVIDQQAALKRLETTNDRLTVEFRERGELNAKLNKENQRLKKLSRW